MSRSTREQQCALIYPALALLSTRRRPMTRSELFAIESNGRRAHKNWTLRVLKTLEARGLVELSGKGNTTHYVAASDEARRAIREINNDAAVRELLMEQTAIGARSVGKEVVAHANIPLQTQLNLPHVPANEIIPGAPPADDAEPSPTIDELLKSFIVWCNHLDERFDTLNAKVDKLTELLRCLAE
jgi:hypothetical protein